VGQVGGLLRGHRLLRGRGAGPTVIVSPLLALMRNQIDAAARAGSTRSR
jgi:superfamily II DNA helicase RecQ